MGLMFCEATGHYAGKRVVAGFSRRLSLGGGTHDDLTDIDVGRLLDREGDRPRDRLGRHRERRRCSNSALAAESVIDSAKLVNVIPGETIVTRRFSPAS
jgi:hypothetical protein